ncbi:MAG: helix-turn-helix domain-containing protein [Candidatus Parcubacteria bacterium]|nr:helix-turn-helix domain-containing protein [Candidatus Parcubacteria bacterium]
MSKFDKKLTALTMRREGESIKDIAEKLNVSKGSVSVWCQDIELTKKQKSHLKERMIKAGHRGRLLGAEMNKKKKADAIAFYRKSGKNDIVALSDKELFVSGLSLYWAEGVKAPQSRLAFVNSDPRLIKLMFRWFQVCMNVQQKEFAPRIFINEIHKKREKKLVEYWSHLLQLPKEQFGNVVFLKMKQKKVYENYDSYFGILSLGVVKSTNLKYRILGLIEALGEIEV